MLESMSITTAEYAKASSESPIEDALSRLYNQQERVEKAVAVLTERLASITQPEEPTPLDAMPGEKSSIPRSPVTSRLINAADDLARLTSRIERLTDRLDV